MHSLEEKLTLRFELFIGFAFFCRYMFRIQCRIVLEIRFYLSDTTVYPIRIC